MSVVVSLMLLMFPFVPWRTILIEMDNSRLVQVLYSSNFLIQILEEWSDLEPINLNLCNAISCGDGRCIVTSRNITYCRCSPGVTGANCDQCRNIENFFPIGHKYPLTRISVIQCNDINCLNNGTCVSLTSGFFRCNCPPGLGGTYCQFSNESQPYPSSFFKLV